MLLFSALDWGCLFSSLPYAPCRTYQQTISVFIVWLSSFILIYVFSIVVITLFSLVFVIMESLSSFIFALLALQLTVLPFSVLPFLVLRPQKYCWKLPMSVDDMIRYHHSHSHSKTQTIPLHYHPSPEPLLAHDLLQKSNAPQGFSDAIIPL